MVTRYESDRLAEYEEKMRQQLRERLEAEKTKELEYKYNTYMYINQKHTQFKNYEPHEAARTTRKLVTPGGRVSHGVAERLNAI